MADQPEMESHTTASAADAIEALLSPVEDAPQAKPDAGDENQDVEDDSESTETEETAESEETDDSDEEQGSIETLSQLAEALELPLEEVMANLKTTVKVNGEELTVTLKEAFDGYQKDADYRHKTTALAEERKSFTEQAAQVKQQLGQEFAQAGFLMQQLEAYVVPKLDQQQLEYLKQTDPAQYVVVKQDYAERAQAFNQMKQAAAGNFQKLQQEMTAARAHQMQEVLQKAATELPTRLGKWDGEVKKTIDDYLTSDRYGYTPEELAQVVDPRLVELAWKASQYDQMKSKGAEVKEKVKTLPKIQPAKKTTAVAAKKTNLQKATARLSKSGHHRDAASAIEYLL